MKEIDELLSKSKKQSTAYLEGWNCRSMEHLATDEARNWFLLLLYWVIFSVVVVVKCCVVNDLVKTEGMRAIEAVDRIHFILGQNTLLLQSKFGLHS